MMVAEVEVVQMVVTLRLRVVGEETVEKVHLETKIEFV